MIRKFNIRFLNVELLIYYITLLMFHFNAFFTYIDKALVCVCASHLLEESYSGLNLTFFYSIWISLFIVE